jgi:hypothetical protein
MKTLLVMSVLAVCVGSAYADLIGAHPDVGGMSCALTNFAPWPGRTEVFVIHQLNAGATAAQFRVVDNSGLMFVGIMSNYEFSGDMDDLTFTYPACITGQHVIATLDFFAFGDETFTCDNVIRIADAPSSPIPGRIVVTLCDFVTVEAAMGETMWVGPKANDCVTRECGVHPVAESTWGGIKAIYRGTP